MEHLHHHLVDLMDRQLVAQLEDRLQVVTDMAVEAEEPVELEIFLRKFKL